MNWPEMSFLNRPEMSFAGGGVQERLHTAPGWWNLRRMSSQQAPIVDTGWQGFSLMCNCQIPDALPPGPVASCSQEAWAACEGCGNLSRPVMRYHRKPVSMSIPGVDVVGHDT
jgi:hypothetical protein